MKRTPRNWFLPITTGPPISWPPEAELLVTLQLADLFKRPLIPENQEVDDDVVAIVEEEEDELDANDEEEAEDESERFIVFFTLILIPFCWGGICNYCANLRVIRGSTICTWKLESKICLCH